MPWSFLHRLSLRRRNVTTYFQNFNVFTIVPITPIFSWYLDSYSDSKWQTWMFTCEHVNSIGDVDFLFFLIEWEEF